MKMTKDELNQSLNTFFQDEHELLAEIYFILKVGTETVLRFADIERDSQIDLTSQFIGKVKSELIEDQNLNVISISDADDRTNVIYEYDLEEIPNELTVIDQIIENEDIETFTFDNDRLEDIRGIVILISHNGENLVLYKKHYPISLFKKDGGFNIKRWGNQQRFTQLDEDIVKINISFDFIKLNNTLFIKDLKTLEKFFGFHDVIKRKAESCLEKIIEAEILENPEDLKTLMEDITFARKMTKVYSSSPVLGKIPTLTIISFVENYPSLVGKFQFNADKSRISLSTNISKQLFIKLLNDDFLQSELTNLYYASLAKDTLLEVIV
ncbi:hypothetical protein GCM10008018_45560 [Paenibacillus marchantiophytorum]|uniref:DUF4868 domain-containing protein n=1 Tax=Paenibacillus marchantiophytorum TaxID=1619310 RepID=A0ABQ1EZR8_9BACL|nr:anti-phage protein KwaB [Paenibacillus marchantiophytorum]GFZ93984.1 hypothetical protein GCM10008018_45560 [Paenibacillus marchantiophytorum]